MTYRENALPDDAPRGWVELVWRWLMLRRQDRLDRETKALDAPKRQRLRATHMVRSYSHEPYTAATVVVSACPGKSIRPPKDINGFDVRDYWLCTPEHCCCEVIR